MSVMSNELGLFLGSDYLCFALIPMGTDAYEAVSLINLL